MLYCNHDQCHWLHLSAHFHVMADGCRIQRRKNEIERSLTNAKDFSSCSHSTALKAAIGSGDVVEASVPTALQTHVCLFYCACCFNTLGGALCSDCNVHFDKQLPVSLGATCPDASVHVHVGFPLQTPDCFRVTGKLRETRSQSVSN